MIVDLLLSLFISIGMVSAYLYWRLNHDLREERDERLELLCRAALRARLGQDPL